MSNSGAAGDWDFIVPVDGDELLAELERHGITPGQRVHLHLVPTGSTVMDIVEPDDLAEALRAARATKRAPFSPARGMLAGMVPVLSQEDFDDASRLAAEGTDQGLAFPE